MKFHQIQSKGMRKSKGGENLIDIKGSLSSNQPLKLIFIEVHKFFYWQRKHLSYYDMVLYPLYAK